MLFSSGLNVYKWRNWNYFIFRLNTISSWSISLMRRLRNLSVFWLEESTWKEPDGIQRKSFWPNHFQNFITINFQPSVSVLAGRETRWRPPKVRKTFTLVQFTGRKRDPGYFCRPAIRPTSSFVLTFPQINLRNIGSTEVWLGSPKSRNKRRQFQNIFWLARIQFNQTLFLPVFQA